LWSLQLALLNPVVLLCWAAALLALPQYFEKGFPVN